MMRINTLALAGGIWAATLTLMGCTPSRSAEDPRTATQIVEIADVQPARAAERAFTGVVSARVQSNLGFRVSGKLIERLVDTGQSVRRGQPLLRLDRTDFEHAVVTQTGNVAAAQARLLQAAADETRYRGLVSSGAVSQSAYDQAKAAADSARALLSSAEAQLKLAEDAGAYATLVADADGTVLETLAEPGQFVSAGQIVIRVAQAGAREAAVNLPETLRPAIGSTAHATLYGAGTDAAGRLTARLRQLSDAADPLTRTFEARYVLDGVAARAPLGATVTVYLNDAEPPGGLAIPLGAISDEGRGAGVWLFNRQSSSISYRPIKLIRFEGERAVVSGAIQPGDPIIAVGGHFLHEGQRVQLALARVARDSAS
ncbi:MAG TPA: efflux RND transporter periplasmic adaptor subunit [Steroidobacteraceae bacterium]|nr:efflux RND transporter periplasmic adaptor subunit [Steroidobacteraceae bacterium]